MPRLSGKIALVTGAAGGIGAAICVRFKAEGAHVVAMDRIASDAGDEAWVCDLADDASIAQGAADLLARLGPPDIIVHAGAATEQADIFASSPQAFNAVYDVNVGGAVRLVQAFAPAMQGAGRGNFVFISSINARMGAPTLAAYAASKGGLETFMKGFALEVAADGLRANCVAPASIDTAMLRASFDRQPDPAAALAANILRHPLGRLGTVEDVANLVLFLASDEAAWITGGVFPVDGGAGITRR